MTDLQTVADKQAITEQIYRYCRAMDRIDHALGYSIWHEDGTADYGAEVFVGTGRGFIDHVNAQHAQLLVHSHQVTNILIEIAGDPNGGTASSEAYVTARLRMERGGKLLQMVVLSRYLDRWSKRGGRWALDHRRAVIDMDEIAEVVPMKQRDGGRRDAGDPSYEFLKGL